MVSALTIVLHLNVYGPAKSTATLGRYVRQLDNLYETRQVKNK